MANYIINAAYVEKYKTAIGRGEPVDVEIRDERTKCFIDVKAILSRTEIEGGERVTPIQMVGDGKYRDEDIFIKILEELPDEAEPIGVWDSPMSWSQV